MRLVQNMDFSSNTSYIIVGLTNDGKKFRPSDWAERLACVFSTFGPDKRLKYSPHVTPGNYNREKVVFLDGRLYDLDPKAYRFALNFAKDNNLQLIEGNKNGPLHADKSPIKLVA
jgi:hypothetical protein